MPWGRWAAGALLFAICFRVLPPLWCGRDAVNWWRGERQTQEALVRGVEQWIQQPLGTDRFKTGSSQFDGEWFFGTYQMAALGLAHFAREHPDARDRCLAGMTLCEDRMLSEGCRKFDRDSWKEDALESLNGPGAHAAYLGYLNLVLSLHRSMDPAFKNRDLNDRITAKLARVLAASPITMIETYASRSGLGAVLLSPSGPSTDFALLIAMLLMLVRLTALWIVLPLSVTWGILTLWRGWDKRGHVSDMQASSSLPSASSTSPQEKPDAGEAAEEKPESGDKHRTKPDGLKRLNLGKPGCGRTVT